MERPVHPTYTELAHAYNEKSPFMTQVVQDVKENNFEKLHFACKSGDELFSKLESPNCLKKQCWPFLLNHGGGIVLESVQAYAKAAIDICLGTNAVVVSVEYSLSPEVKYPVANKEVYSTLCWAKEIAIAGDSAGKNIADVVSLMAKDRGMGNVIKAQILLYLTFFALSGYPSFEFYGQGNYVLSSQDILDYAEVYMPTEMSDLPSHYAKPLTAITEQLQGLPPVLVLTCQCDVLRDEGEAYAKKLLEAGVDVVGIRMLGTTHAFMSRFPAEISIYKRGLNTVIDFIKEKLNY